MTVALPTSVWINTNACATGGPFPAQRLAVSVESRWLRLVVPGRVDSRPPSQGTATVFGERHVIDTGNTGSERDPQSERTVADIGEFAVIDRAVSGREQPATTILGPGDDAAVVRAEDGRVVVSSDMLVEGRHFRFDWSTPHQVGRKAVAQNAADIVSMGAWPTAFLVSLGCPPDTPVSVADALSDGIATAAAALGAGVVGGDTVQSDQVVLSITVLGDLRGRDAVLRSGARPGDQVALAGRAGWSAAGLAVLLAGVDGFPEVVDAHRVPSPPYRSGVDASRSGATAMTDVSDGLVADLGHLCAASGVGVDLDPAALAPDPPLRAAAQALGADAFGWVLTGGEDHGLAATFPPDASLPDGWRRIGVVRAGAGVLVGGREWAGPGGWQSFDG
ncbi:thiamine-phosphate kinase [Rhodococcus sp. NPDC003318]|uniref:thiamine-phosphate kinase n=1 Tax=Rhodococcus sp. NPDC003318 TaxID=3364503 RepID=UPI0036A82365